MAVYMLYDQRSAAIKIGFTSSDKPRLSGNATGNPNKLVSLAFDLSGSKHVERLMKAYTKFEPTGGGSEWRKECLELFEWARLVREEGWTFRKVLSRLAGIEVFESERIRLPRPEREKHITSISIGRGYTRRCSECGGVQELELRQWQSKVLDQPRCRKCR